MDLGLDDLSLFPSHEDGGQTTGFPGQDKDEELALDLGVGGLSLPGVESSSDSDDDMDITGSREQYFNRRTGRFSSPESGEFERGSAPPDLDSDVNRYRGESGRFKKSAADLYDEPEEVRQGSLEPEG